jgi:hypothetical protein
VPTLLQLLGCGSECASPSAKVEELVREAREGGLSDEKIIEELEDVALALEDGLP